MTYLIANQSSQKGNILLSSLLILVAMNLLGAGLMQSATRELNTATFKSIDSEVFQITETCAHDVITYFESQTGTPSSVDDISESDISLMMTGSETTTETNKLTGYSYGCSTTYITSKNVESGVGTGGEIGGSGGEYGGSGSLALKDYYQVTSTGSGPDNAQKVINTIISVEY
jgi:Tfp pilus assembly protein PilX